MNVIVVIIWCLTSPVYHAYSLSSHVEITVCVFFCNRLRTVMCAKELAGKSAKQLQSYTKFLWSPPGTIVGFFFFGTIYFSKWVEVIPTKTKHAAVVADALFVCTVIGWYDMSRDL